MIKHISNKEEFLNAIKEGTVLVDFFAKWCGPCRMLGPVLEEIDEKGLTKATIIKVDTDEAQELAQMFRIQFIPTLILFKNGEKVNEANGFLPKERLLQFIGE